jgi:hypothetical protein
MDKLLVLKRNQMEKKRKRMKKIRVNHQIQEMVEKPIDTDGPKL